MKDEGNKGEGKKGGWKEGNVLLLLCFSWGTMAWGLAWVELRSRQWFGMRVGGGIYQDGDEGVWWMQVFFLYVIVVRIIQ